MSVWPPFWPNFKCWSAFLQLRLRRRNVAASTFASALSASYVYRLLLLLPLLPAAFTIFFRTLIRSGISLSRPTFALFSSVTSPVAQYLGTPLWAIWSLHFCYCPQSFNVFLLPVLASKSTFYTIFGSLIFTQIVNVPTTQTINCYLSQLIDVTSLCTAAAYVDLAQNFFKYLSLFWKHTETYYTHIHMPLNGPQLDLSG